MTLKNNLFFKLLVMLAIVIVNYSVQAEQAFQNQVFEHQQIIFSAQKQDNCKKIIQHMELLNALTQDIPSALYYFQANCYSQQKQYVKAKPILENYFFYALHDDKYYNRALKLYAYAEENLALDQGDQNPVLMDGSITSNKLQQIKLKTGIDFIKIKSGCFDMGSPSTEAERVNDEKQHRVCLTKPFLLGKYEITQGQWEAVMSTTPAHFVECGSRCPVENISWQDIQAFIKILKIKTGFQFRLPTEAEWEYAARAGTKTPFSFGENINTSQVNYDGDHPYVGKEIGRDRKSPIAVGSLPPNPWGLYDMHGNVWEFVQDWHNIDYYKNSPTNNPKGPAKGTFHIRRGGSWRFGARFCRSAYRGRFRPDSMSTLLGFRLAISL